uniref:Uncharacterized protein n=1 Tax=Arundo donax TaxID=35708 RepID=A0A0A9F5W0_ARUDO
MVKKRHLHERILALRYTDAWRQTSIVDKQTMNGPSIYQPCHMNQHKRISTKRIIQKTYILYVHYC